MRIGYIFATLDIARSRSEIKQASLFYFAHSNGL